MGSDLGSSGNFHVRRNALCSDNVSSGREGVEMCVLEFKFATGPESASDLGDPVTSADQAFEMKALSQGPVSVSRVPWHVGGEWHWGSYPGKISHQHCDSVSHQIRALSPRAEELASRQNEFCVQPRAAADG